MSDTPSDEIASENDGEIIVQAFMRRYGIDEERAREELRELDSIWRIVKDAVRSAMDSVENS